MNPARGVSLPSTRRMLVMLLVSALGVTAYGVTRFAGLRRFRGDAAGRRARPRGGAAVSRRGRPLSIQVPPGLGRGDAPAPAGRPRNRKADLVCPVGRASHLLRAAVGRVLTRSPAI